MGHSQVKYLQFSGKRAHDDIVLKMRFIFSFTKSTLLQNIEKLTWILLYLAAV